MPIAKIFLLAIAFLLLPTQAIALEKPTVYTDNVRYEMERDFYRLKIPTGKIDGEIDSNTMRAVCLWRELTGRTPLRAYPTKSDIQAIANTDYLFPTTEMKLGLNINLTCQTALWLREDIENTFSIFKISSGKSGFETIPGTFTVGWLIDDWYESRSYPDGRMYRPQFFNMGQALHGSSVDSAVHSYPASHGCVRMLHKDVDYLWENGFGKGSVVNVYGKWRW